MYITETILQVQYYETDQMGVVHHSNYIRYYETARTNFIKSLGISYRQLEESGTLMPIINVSCKYIQPATYDETLTIKTFLKELPTSRITFYYEIYNQAGMLINEGQTILAFINQETQRPCRTPEILMARLVPLFSE
jgi:acyl-CoA thioester hydrolase